MKLFLGIIVLTSAQLSSPSFAAQVEDGDAELQEFRLQDDSEAVLQEVAARQRVQPSRPGTRDCYRQLSICESACLKRAEGNSSIYRQCTLSCPVCETD